MIKKIYSLLIIMLQAAVPLIAQDKEAEMADVLRQNGKIYNVVAVVMIVFTGFLVYLFITERKLSKLERQVKK